MGREPDRLRGETPARIAQKRVDPSARGQPLGRDGWAHDAEGSTRECVDATYPKVSVDRINQPLPTKLEISRNFSQSPVLAAGPSSRP